MSSRKLEDMLVPLPERQTYTGHEVCAILGVSRARVRQMVNAGILKPIQFSDGSPTRTWRLYHRAQVDAILNAWRGEPADEVPEAGFRILEGGRHG